MIYRTCREAFGLVRASDYTTVEDLPLQFKAMRTRFSEARGNDDSTVNADVCTLSDYSRNRIGRRDYNDQVHMLSPTLW